MFRVCVCFFSRFVFFLFFLARPGGGGRCGCWLMTKNLVLVVRGDRTGPKMRTLEWSGRTPQAKINVVVALVPLLCVTAVLTSCACVCVCVFVCVVTQATCCCCCCCCCCLYDPFPLQFTRRHHKVTPSPTAGGSGSGAAGNKALL